MEKAVAKVQNETQTVHMAAFLGEMWKEMRTLAAPFFVEHLENRTVTLKKKEKVLQKKFDEAKKELKDEMEDLEEAEDKLAVEQAKHAKKKAKAEAEDEDEDEEAEKASSAKEPVERLVDSDEKSDDEKASSAKEPAERLVDS